MIERACFNEQLSVSGEFGVYKDLNVPHGTATCAPPVRTCALPTFRFFCIRSPLPGFPSHSLIKGGVFFLRSGELDVCLQ